MHDYIKLMEEFGAAFNRHDEDALALMMTEDCVFYTLVGEHDFGTKIEGNTAVKAAFAGVWRNMPNAHWQALNCFASGNNGLSQWLFSGTNTDGSHIHAQGCDIFTFRDGKIHTKNAFRKQVLA